MSIKNSIENNIYAAGEVRNNIIVNYLDKENSSNNINDTDVKFNRLTKIKLLDNEDHNYSNVQFIKTDNMENNAEIYSKSNIIYSKVASSGKEKFIGLKITNINDLKKATPHLKLPTMLTSQVTNKSPTISEEVRQKLLKYCRTCAGLKIPLVDIFSEKGMQMRLSQQIQHLENINEHDSLSTQMCMDCICDMKMSYKFFMQIKKAEMKLKLISNSNNDSVNKSDEFNIETKIKTEVDDISSFEELSTVNTNSDFDISDIKVDSNDYNVSEENDNYSEFNESFEEFDPDITNENIDDKNIVAETIVHDIIDKSKSTAYKYDESLQAYVKVGNTESSETENESKSTVLTENIVKESVNSGTLTQSLIKIPNILKRKLSSSNVNIENIENINKKEFQKVNIDIRDLKIPKLDLQDPANIKTEEDGIMYVTAKGSKPNEMLLIKVKKMDKLMDKKGEKTPAKKKIDSSTMQKVLSKYEYSLNHKINAIDEQIEQYKKKRVEVLGDIANVTEEKSVEDEPEFRIQNKNNSSNLNFTEEKEDKISGIDMEDRDPLNTDKQSLDVAPRYISRLEKLKQRWKDIKKRHENTNSDLAENTTDRLKTILNQKDEYIQEFANYLKQRRIVASRLKDEDIIALYEAKNNIILENVPISSEVIEEEQEEEQEEEVDPFEIKESYECDFCNQVFANRDIVFEHSKIHDIKLMHYCEDCKQEFTTHKAKRSHNITCVQKLLCKYCNLILESKGKKRQHEQKHCDEIYGQLCDLCGEKFKHQGTLDQHVKSRHMELEKIYKCPQCSKKFAFRTKLTFHLKSVHTTSRAYLCEDCGSDFKNPASLRHHRMRKHQATNNKKECSVCNKLVPVYSMSKHMHTHKSYSIQCPHCDKMFKNTSTLKQHTRIHEDQRQYKCDMCGVGFNRRDGLRLHLRVHTKSDSRGLKECSCQICGEKFPNHSMLVIHRNRTHKDGRNYTCYICNRSMISTRSLEWHLAHIHNERLPGTIKEDSTVDSETKRVSCYSCNKTFKTEMILRTHVKNTHVEKQPVKCLDCDLLFTSEVRLKHHMMVLHNRLEGTLTCPHCPKRFVNQLRLKTHMISHSDERPHTCDLCGFMLKTKIQLIKHKQNRHSNERPLQCRYCSWRCKQVSALVCHERTHTNERPYTCSVCKQKFKYLGDKNKHERRHESLGGSGFKRIVTGRNTSKVRKQETDSNDQDSDQDQEEEYSVEQEKDDEEYEEQGDEEMEGFDQSQIVKFESTEAVTEESNTCFEQIYVEDGSQESSNTNEVVMGVEETAVYTEEVTADNVEPEIITNDVIDEQILQPGTVVHLQQEDETGKIQVIPVMLSLPDLSDATSEVNLATTSIMYNN